MSQEQALSRTGLYGARPTVEIDGQRNVMVQSLLRGLVVEERLGGLSALEMQFCNSAGVSRRGIDFAFEHGEPDLLSLGRPIRVYTGDENDPREIFHGLISGLEFQAEPDQEVRLNVLGEDGLQKARMSRHTRLFEETTLSELIETIAADLGLRAEVSGLSDNLAAEMQLNESDLAFLRRLLQRYNGDLQIVGDRLQAAPRGEIRRSEVTLELNAQLLSVRVLADLAHQVTDVTFSGWDAAQGTRIEANSSVGEPGPGRGASGAELLRESFGDRPEHLGNQAARDDSEAQALVDAQYTRRAGGFVRVQGTAQGNPSLRVGSHVTLQGLGPRFENTYFVTRASHRFDQADGYRTEFDAECAYLGG